MNHDWFAVGRVQPPPPPPRLVSLGQAEGGTPSQCLIGLGLDGPEPAPDELAQHDEHVHLKQGKGWDVDA